MNTRLPQRDRTTHTVEDWSNHFPRDTLYRLAEALAEWRPGTGSSTSGVTHATIVDRWVAFWYMSGRVAHVHAVTAPDGTFTDFPDSPALGDAFDRIVHRPLWLEVRHQVGLLAAGAG